MTAVETNGHDDTPVADIIPAHEGRVTLEQIPDLYAAPDRRLISLLPKTSCKACSDKRGGACDKHRMEKCKTCGAWISSAHIHLDFVGHAEVTLILTRVDPMWSWDARAWAEDGGPVIRQNGSTLELWGTLTVLGKTLPCVGTTTAKAESSKELIGDMLRNGAMRFGIGTGLWSKVEAADREHAYGAEEAKLAPAAPEKPAVSKTQRATTRARKAAEEATDPAAEAEAAQLAESRRAPVDDYDPVYDPDGEGPINDADAWFIENGWANQTEHDRIRKETLAAAKRLPEPRREAIKAELAQWDIDPARALTAKQVGFFRFLIADHAALEAGLAATTLRAAVLAATDGANSRMVPGQDPAVADKAVTILARLTYEDLDEQWSDAGGLTLVAKDGEVVAKYEPEPGSEPF